MERKIFLLANTHGCVNTGARIYSLIESAKESGFDSYHYLTGCMTTASTMNSADVSQVASVAHKWKVIE